MILVFLQYILESENLTLSHFVGILIIAIPKNNNKLKNKQILFLLILK